MALTFDEIIGCHVESVEIFEVSIKLHLLKRDRRFSITSLGDLNIDGCESSTTHISDGIALALRRIVGDSIRDISRTEYGVDIYFSGGAVLKIHRAECDDYSISYREEKDGVLGPEALE